MAAARCGSSGVLGSPTRAWLGESPTTPASCNGSYQPSECTSAESTNCASVSEPSSTAIRAWTSNLFKTVRDDPLITPRPVGYEASELTFTEEDTQLKLSVAKRQAQSNLRRKCCKALVGAVLLATVGTACVGAKRLHLTKVRLPSGPSDAVDVDERKHALCVYGEGQRCPARELFESPEVFNVAAENLMQVGSHVLTPEDREVVWASVAAGFRNISAQLAERAPEVARNLDAIRLTQPQKIAVLASMRLMSLPQVQSVGLTVAEAIRDSGCSLKECVQQRIEAKLEPRLGHLRALTQKLVPVSLQQLWSQEGHHWEMTLDPENIRVFESVIGSFVSKDATQNKTARLLRTPQARLNPEEKSSLVLGGVLEEARALLDVMRMCTRLSGKELAVPMWATSLAGAWSSFGYEVASCEADDGSSGDRQNLLKELFCPLRFGAQGIDALRAALATASV